MATGIAQAAVPPDMAKELVNIGRGVCVPEPRRFIVPCIRTLPYTGVTIARDIFRTRPENGSSTSSPPQKGGKNRTVLIYVSGGAGQQTAGRPGIGDVLRQHHALGDNGMVGVNMQRRPGTAWDDPAKDISLVVQWVNQNISKYKGNPRCVFLWAQSAGNVPAVRNVGHPEFYGPPKGSVSKA